jgi:hypothetical protein
MLNYFMISRFNLDQKRLNFYEDIEKFNNEFSSINSMTNKEEFDYLAEKPSVIINKEKTLKLSLIRKDKEFTYILFSNHSLSILPEESIKVHKASKENTSFELFSLKD